MMDEKICRLSKRELTHKLLSKITFEDMPKLLEFMKLIANKMESLKNEGR